MNKKMMYGALCGIFTLVLLTACNGQGMDDSDMNDDMEHNGGEELDEDVEDENIEDDETGEGIDRDNEEGDEDVEEETGDDQDNEEEIYSN
ncbi:hypothetical protein HNR44_000509 [Geomicrobium halophilum]|uniref:Uncharacterized protein n=1 Tax=Geomicrobium halophilum TaxID=549000 RepID=A0A841PID9_9BACL|nr:hypothetical protein [Geomicrobium halophilum]MBB6448560.1 hypothetical protein [Geomicrobium halophilum]